MRELSNVTKLCGSIGAKSSKFGMVIHNAGYKALGLDFLYLAFAAADLKKAVLGLKALGFRGFGVTTPYKQTVMQYLDDIDPIASEIGAVNTVVNDNGKLTGYNSDWIGAVNALEESTTLKDKDVILVGSGGVSRAIAFGLKNKGAKITVYNRTVANAKTLVESLGLKFGGDLAKLKNAKGDIIINATPLSSETEISAVFHKDIFRKGVFVMDIPFSSLKTNLLLHAERYGCTIVPGYRMLLHQAAFQFEKYTGKKAPFEAMKKALVEAMKRG